MPRQGQPSEGGGIVFSQNIRISRAARAVAAAGFLLLISAGSARAAVEGDVDTSFGSDGEQRTVVGTRSGANAMAIQSNGKIVAAGYTTTLTTDMAVVRYNVNGSLDTSFGTGGIQVTSVAPFLDDQATAVAIQPDGKIVVAGTTYNGKDDDFAVVRYTSTGSLDTTFGSGGIVTLGIGASTDRATALALQPDGKIIVAGYFWNGLGDDMALVRFTATGALDATFDGDGIQTTTPQLGSNTDRAHGIALQENGRIVVVGYATYENDDTTVVRYNPNGSLDAGFGTGGIQTNDFAPEDRATAVAIQPSGEIVVIGYGVVPDQGHQILVARYSTGGSLLGRRFPLNGFRRGRGTAVALQPDGKIVVAADADGFDVARLTRNGYLDPSFGNGTGGVARGPLETQANAGVALQRDGKIITAGPRVHFRLVRWLGDLTPPWGARMIGVPRYSLAPTRTVSWTASDTGTGVKSFNVQRRGAAYNVSTYGAWAVWLLRTPNVYGTFTAAPGSTQCLRVRGWDFAGNVGFFSPPSCEAIPLDERSMSATGSWTDLSASSYYRGTAMSSTTAGSELTVGASYRNLAVVVTTCPGCGTLRVFRGATLLKEINLTSALRVHKKVIQVDSATTVQSGTIKLRQSSAGEAVIIEGLAVSLA